MKTQLPAEDEALLRHYREQVTEQPSAALDAQILAAARQSRGSVRQSALGRLTRWLAAFSLAQRGSLAFGSVASVLLAVGLVLQGLPDAAREGVEHRSAAGPVELSASFARLPAPQEQRKQARMGSPAQPAPPAQPTRPAAVQRAPAPAPRAAAVAAPKPGARLDAGLLQVLRLREQGLHLEAEQRLRQLREEHPDAALQERLAELARAGGVAQ